jgi:hypothetical protein
MTKTSNGLPLTIPLEIPAYWTPEQAFAVVELLDDLRDRIWAHYSAQLLDQYREQYGPADSHHTDDATIRVIVGAGARASGRLSFPATQRAGPTRRGGRPSIVPGLQAGGARARAHAGRAHFGGRAA